MKPNISIAFRTPHALRRATHGHINNTLVKPQVSLMMMILLKAHASMLLWARQLLSKKLAEVLYYKCYI